MAWWRKGDTPFNADLIRWRIYAALGGDGLPSTARTVHFWDPSMVFTVLADLQVPKGAGPSIGTLLTLRVDMVSTNILWQDSLCQWFWITFPPQISRHFLKWLMRFHKIFCHLLINCGGFLYSTILKVSPTFHSIKRTFWDSQILLKLDWSCWQNEVQCQTMQTFNSVALQKDSNMSVQVCCIIWGMGRDCLWK